MQLAWPVKKAPWIFSKTSILNQLTNVRHNSNSLTCHMSSPPQEAVTSYHLSHGPVSPNYRQLPPCRHDLWPPSLLISPPSAILSESFPPRLSRAALITCHSRGESLRSLQEMYGLVTPQRTCVKWAASSVSGKGGVSSFSNIVYIIFCFRVFILSFSCKISLSAGFVESEEVFCESGGLDLALMA